jgi:ZIP family zinc transporter
MAELWKVTYYGLLTGIVGTGAGGIAACFVSGRNRRAVSFMLEYSGGLMMAVVCFDLLPGAFEHAPLSVVISGVLAGVALMVLSEGLIARGNKDYEKADGGKRSGLRGTAVIIALGVAIHNFPEGLAVGSGFEAERELGIKLALAIMLHDVPEGMSIAVPLRAGGSGRMRAFLLALASGLPMGLGAFLGALAGQVSPMFIAACLSIAGGAMLYVVFADMIPESKRTYGGRLGPAGSILGIITGFIVSTGLKL